MRRTGPRPALGHHDHVHDHIRDYVHDLRAASALGAIIKNGHDHEHGHYYVHDHEHDHEHVQYHDHVHDLCAVPRAGP